MAMAENRKEPPGLDPDRARFGSLSILAVWVVGVPGKVQGRREAEKRLVLRPPSCRSGARGGRGRDLSWVGPDRCASAQREGTATKHQRLGVGRA
jgi:hypothetical protein